MHPINRKMKPLASNPYTALVLVIKDKSFCMKVAMNKMNQQLADYLIKIGKAYL